MDLFYGMDNELIKSLLVKMGGEASEDDVTAGVTSYLIRIRKWSVILKQLEEFSGSQTLFLMEDLNLPDICWKGNTEGCK